MHVKIHVQAGCGYPGNIEAVHPHDCRSATSSHLNFVVFTFSKLPSSYHSNNFTAAKVVSELQVATHELNRERKRKGSV